MIELASEAVKAARLNATNMRQPGKATGEGTRAEIILSSTLVEYGGECSR
jgi:hypothetical protein